MDEISGGDGVNRACDGRPTGAGFAGEGSIAGTPESRRWFDRGGSPLGTPPPELARASPARMYDFYLGGGANFTVDRVAARRVISAYPGVVAAARANRSFLRRAVGFLTGQGVDQFLDLGSGVPTVGNVHDIAQRANPAARVAYVDIDPVAAAHSATMLTENQRAEAVRADLAEPAAVLTHPRVRALLDLTRPVAVLMISVLVFVPDEKDPAGVVAAYRDAIGPGSYLALSHGYTNPAAPDTGVGDAQAVYQDTTAAVTLRTAAQITGLFTGFDLVHPGLVPVTAWRPANTDPPGEAAPVLAGVAGKP